MNYCTLNFIKIYELIGIVLYIIKYAIPLIIIGYGVFDLYKAVISNGDNILKKQITVFLKRIISGLIIFFLPTVILFVFELIGVSMQSDCIYKCVLDVKSCNTVVIEETVDNENLEYNDCTIDDENCIDNTIFIEN